MISRGCLRSAIKPSSRFTLFRTRYHIHTQIDKHLSVIKELSRKGHTPRDGIKFIIKSEHLETSFITKPRYNEIREKTKLIIRQDSITLEPKIGVTKKDIIDMWGDNDKKFIDNTTDCNIDIPLL